MEFYTKKPGGVCPYTGEQGVYVEDVQLGQIMTNSAGEYYLLHTNGSSYPLEDRTDKASLAGVKVLK